MREGIDDLRYLYTLEQAIVAAQGDPAKAEAAAAAQMLLDDLRADLNRYGPEARPIIAYFEPQDYRRYRWEIAQAILALQGPSPTPTATPEVSPMPTATPTAGPLPSYLPLLVKG